MTGTIINIITVLIGGMVGMTLGDRMPGRIKETVMAGLGLFTLAIGVQMFLDSTNPVVVLISLLFGGTIRHHDFLDPGSGFLMGFLNEGHITQHNAHFSV